MKKIIISFFILSQLTFIGINKHDRLLIAQEKLLTIEDAVTGQWKQLYPEYLHQIQWRGNSETYSWIENDKLMVGSIKSKEIKTITSIDEINKVIIKKGASKLSFFPEITWIDENTIKFSNDNYIFEYNFNQNNFTVLIKYDNEAKNEDYCHINSKLAYTIDNNLFITGVNNDVVQITNDNNKNIINGQRVHRDEFGIDKGTFWSPKGNFLAFYRMDQTMVTDYPLVDITKRIAMVDNIKYPMAGMKSHEVTVMVYNLKTKTSITLKTGEPAEQYLTNVAWSPDEKNIFIAVLNRDQNYLKFNQYDASSGDFIKTLFEEKNDKYVEPLHSMIFLESKPDEFIWQSQRDGFNHLYLYNINGKLIKQITKGDWIVTDFIGFNKVESEVYYLSTQQSPIERQLYKTEIASGKTIKLTNVPGTHRCLICKTDKFIIDTYSSTNIPYICDIIDTKNKVVKNLLTSRNPLELYKLPQMTIFTIKAADNKTDLYCRIIIPVNFDPNKKYPAIIYVYGGPHEQLINNRWLGGSGLWDFYMASKGYIMLTIDNRGSSNRGLEFENIIYRNLGTVELDDQLKGIEYLRLSGFADMKRIGIFGWSYGGFLTVSLMTKHNDVFKVGVAGGPVIDWKYYEIMYGERYMNKPDENPEGYKNANLINYAENLKGKLLIIHGGIDNTVVWQHSLLFINECINKGIPIDYFVYPRDEHNVRGAKRLHLMKKITQYFDDFL